MKHYTERKEDNANPITPAAILNEVNNLISTANSLHEQKGLFLVRTANRVIEQAKTNPVPQRLFGDLWFERELCILFADTNLGKSILAVQMGNAISQGIPVAGFILQADKQKVLYFDFELSEKQFENRYSIDYKNHYQFDDNFIRGEIDPNAEIPDNMLFEDYLNDSLVQAIEDTGAKVLIIDNLTYLKNETEKAKDALPLMKHLKALKTKYGLSILALAHTPKRDLSKPITRNDLQGSKMLINFCDSAFAIGESSSDKSLRYLKQIKARNTELMHDAENVCVCQIVKPGNFLKFELTGFATEREHLRQEDDKERSELENSIKEILDEDNTATAYTIAKQLCPDDAKFDSFKVKVRRIVSRIRNTY